MNFPTLLWLTSIVTFLVIAARASRIRPVSLPHLTGTTIGILLVLLIPPALRVVSYQPDRIHRDDLLTASFSLSFHPRTANFFAGVPEDGAWVAKFPASYFFLQKLFLRITGASVLTVKLSILPYVLIVSLMTYLITSLILNRFAAVIAVILYAFMPISLYLETLGLHFISSTAVFMVFTYLLLRAVRQNKPLWFASTGVAAAVSYLFYTSSYIAFPILLPVLLIHAIKHKTVKLAAWALIGCVVTIAPFAISAVTQENYFVSRVNQVSLLSGSWSDKRDVAKTIPGTARIVWVNTILSLRAMITDGIGGHGGYTFNRQAMFHRVGLILFLVGLGMSVVLMWRKRELALILLVIAISFITGVVLTIPPPAYHRFSLAFPFIAIVSAVPFPYLVRLLPKRTGILIICVLLALYGRSGIRYFQKAVEPEALPPDAAIIRYVNTMYPNQTIHIAAFPTFALERLFPFFQPYRVASVDTQYHNYYLTHFNRDERYVYVMIMPEVFEKEFRRADPTGTFIAFSDTYGVFTNVSDATNPAEPIEL